MECFETFTEIGQTLICDLVAAVCKFTKIIEQKSFTMQVGER